MDALDLVFLAVAVLWTLVAARGLLDLAALPDLPPRAASSSAARPSVTVVVPARDEEARIAETVERLLAQEDVELEVVVVDDRSRDRTAERVRALAQRDARVKLVQVTELPSGWLGKPHACQRGAEAARGEWLLFTDGDVWLARDVVRRAIDAGNARDAQHVTLAARLDEANLFAQAAVATFGGPLVMELARANRDHPKSGAGIGAFNLVRADAWRAIGGHERLAYEVVDDLRLGKLLRRGGFRTRAFLAARDASVVWARTLFDLPRALEKNFFAQFGYRTSVALAAALAIALPWLVAVVAPFTGRVTGFAAFAGLWTTIAPGLRGAARQGLSPFVALLAPLFVWILPVAILRSTWSTLRAGGVRWRDTFYPLAELRARRVR